MLLSCEKEEIQELAEELNCTTQEAGIIYLRQEGYTYAQIRLKLGNPSNKLIRQTLLKYAPNLIENNEKV